ncbi:hypothetical protein DPMN_043409 [Dreissena polymorpha]|uniref:Uncharacterized protein n=1 Tax=Dreissena polymorpha TaxID=45954 RepID=A0A9D4D2N1_DREPO|nr:hypothetical protein DPMN_043409 [Dreissena polymorpha]
MTLRERGTLERGGHRGRQKKSWADNEDFCIVGPSNGKSVPGIDDDDDDDDDNDDDDDDDNDDEDDDDDDTLNGRHSQCNTIYQARCVRGE